MHLSDHITLAVLPFENLFQKADVNIFCRSFSSDLITELSKFRVSCPYNSAADVPFSKLDPLNIDYAAR
jgi:hypothetical protein